MKFDDVWIAGAGAALGNLVSAADAVADGRYPRGWAMWAGMSSVSVSELFPGELAVIAGREALQSSSIDPGAIGLHVFSSMSFPGLYAWPVSHFVARRLIPPFSGLSFWNNAFSASSLAAIEIGASMMCGRPDIQAALLTTGDRFHLPDVDRWKHDRGLVFGDGGGALVLSRAGGWARLKCVVSWTDPELEEMHRGEDVLCSMGETRWPVDQSKRYNDYFAKDEVVLPKVVERSSDNAKRCFPKRWPRPRRVWTIFVG
ncbi:hypothetical protein CAI21_13645 [Alkalilimnicola ehrlichii]|uniref:Uncharacterized protein n=1 Tax=Alkalilimnicola ehrlichii TaxID=351052 RepID=A0A3E0WRJ4_9GAMM|nr:hypothetical protein [Alkalilimnicola ehrlichii]RFA27959.1 hypothetical protein CAI21_13645 [Alkalilimnicola ehrlichii]RFA34606.1 hypothetical protein CAL65_14670 [Alkalilimnicola ehrlichii]